MQAEEIVAESYKRLHLVRGGALIVAAYQIRKKKREESINLDRMLRTKKCAAAGKMLTLSKQSSARGKFLAAESYHSSALSW